MVELGVLFLVGAAVCGLLVVALLFKAVLWAVLLPLRMLLWLLGGLLLLPFLLLKTVLGGIVLLVALPFLVLAAAVGLVIGAFGILLPLLPFILLAMLLWWLIRDQPTAVVKG